MQKIFKWPFSIACLSLLALEHSMPNYCKLIFMTLYMHICIPLLVACFPLVAGVICCMGGAIIPNVMHQLSIRLSVSGNVSMALLLLALLSLFNLVASIAAKSRTISVGLNLAFENGRWWWCTCGFRFWFIYHGWHYAIALVERLVWVNLVWVVSVVLVTLFGFTV